ncbi:MULTISPECIES: Hsp20/alpha crystallin family protein [unclassified Microcoleus]|uniref:Hsp20/alpha crystallin family protein n=1 Tax=unclassified Microcoleus TaxID=2642155 RepID=UPI002FD3FBCA
MNAFQASKDLSQYLEGSFSSLLKGGQQLTLWMRNTGKTPIAAITIHESETTLMLKVHILGIHLVKLDLQITPETLLIQGQPTEATLVEGYFRPSRFESLIALPHPVEPETCRTQIQPDGVKIQLAKQSIAQQSKLCIELPTANSIFG